MGRIEELGTVIGACRKCGPDCRPSFLPSKTALVAVVTAFPLDSYPDPNVPLLLGQFLSFCGLLESDWVSLSLTMCGGGDKAVCGEWKPLEFMAVEPKVVILVGEEVVRYFYPTLEFNSLGELDQVVHMGTERFGGGQLVMFMAERYDPEFEATVWGINSAILHNLLGLS